MCDVISNLAMERTPTLGVILITNAKLIQHWSEFCCDDVVSFVHNSYIYNLLCSHVLEMIEIVNRSEQKGYTCDENLS